MIGMLLGMGVPIQKIQALDMRQLRVGYAVEMEHWDTVGFFARSFDLRRAAILKIAFDHLEEFRDYYTRLERMESEAEAFWSRRTRSN
jgi:hypothetical protein